ncbi:MAG: four helix bundle protein [Firmicutes bacterium]|jgi:four helix bundle protein|nr:four helix bundle protein [Bacillota bacterium]
MFRYRKIKVYSLAQDIILECYSIVEMFPNDEKYSLSKQINRAAVSIISNIAEGSGRFSDKDKIHFFNMSYSSMLEMMCQMELAEKLGYVDEKRFKNFESKVKNLSIRLSNFIKSIK